MSFPDALAGPRTPDPLDAPSLRWGVLGTGWIAGRFVTTVRQHTTQRFVAVAARDAGRAASFARAHGIDRSYASYEELAADPDVDVVYVATVHEAHLDCARLALEAGKHTLVEKPLALTADQAREVAATASRRGLFCAEALWSLFLPRYDVVRQVLEAGVLGEVHTVIAEYSEHFTDHRILNPDQVSGPLADLGTYPLAVAGWVLGPTTTVVSATGRDHPNGVNGQVAAILDDGAGHLGLVHTSVFADTPAAVTIAGTGATLTLPQSAYQPGQVVLTRAGGGASLTWDEPRIGHEGLFFEATEAARCIASGLTETPLRPLADTVHTLTLMDDVRSRCGIVYPDERRR